MQIPLQVTFRDVPQSDAVESRIRSKVDKLERFYSNITGCRVVVEMPRKHSNQGKLFNVRVDLKVPQGEIVVTGHSNKDVYVAMRDAFNSVGRRLQDHGKRQHADVKTHDLPLYGQVASVYVENGQGYGFIETEDGTEYYFSDENLTDPIFTSLSPGVEVQFLESTGREGLQAKRVSVRHHETP